MEEHRERLMSYVEAGLTLAEIAGEFGVSVSTAGVWVKDLGIGGTRRARRIAKIKAARAAGCNSAVLRCSKHGETPFWVGRNAVRCKKCNTAAVTKRRREVKRILIDEAGGSCSLCGYDRSLAALEFHHLEPRAKSFGLSQAGITRALELSRAEAAKCVVLCANCHAEVEAGVAVVPVR